MEVVEIAIHKLLESTQRLDCVCHVKHVSLIEVGVAEKQEKSFMDECRAQWEEGTGKIDYSHPR